jgi:hypothetical protein
MSVWRGATLLACRGAHMSGSCPVEDKIIFPEHKPKFSLRQRRDNFRITGLLRASNVRNLNFAAHSKRTKWAGFRNHTRKTPSFRSGGTPTLCRQLADHRVARDNSLLKLHSNLFTPTTEKHIRIGLLLKTVLNKLVHWCSELSSGLYWRVKLLSTDG